MNADKVDSRGFWMHDGYRITISSMNGEKITKVSFIYLDDEVVGAKATVGHIEEEEWGGTIYDINATSLEMFSNDASERFVSEIVVYYETVMDEYMQAESFSIDNALSYSGRNVTITGTKGDKDGLHIDNGESVTIISENGMRIMKVDLGFSVYDKEDPIDCSVGGVDGWGKQYTINNVNSSSLKIKTTYGESNAQINYVKVYYMEIVEENTESFTINSGCNYLGENVSVSGTNADSDGLQIAQGNSVTITSENGVEIVKVDLVFSNSNGYSINSTAGIATPVKKNKCNINNVYSSSLTITNPGDGYMQISGIAVHYREKIIPTISVATNRTAPREYWATFYSDDGNYQAPDGTKVYIVNLNGTSIAMTEIADGIVNSEQGVVLMSETGDIVMTKTNNESSGDYSDNSLLGTPFEITNPGNAYVLNYKTTKGVGFYKLSSTGSIPANRAYLVYDNANGTAQAFFAFDSAATGIEINKADANENDQEVYDLQGRRVAKPANGLYIVNGKKVIMK